jgi:hypothetical protein
MRRVRDRWPAGVGDPHVSIPVALLRHAKALGLDDGDVRFLLALESFDWGNGRPVAPSQETLAALCGGVSVKTIQRRADKLERLGLIERERTRGARATWGSYSYTRRGLGNALQQLETERRQRTTVSGGEDADQRTTVSAGDGVDQRTPMSDDQRTPVSPDQRTPVSGDSEAVEAEAETQTHTARAREVLSIFNELAGTNFRAGGFVAQVEAIVKEHPDLSASDHRVILEAAFADPWWTNSPSPSVVYKDSKQFERALNAVNSVAPRRQPRLTVAEQVEANYRRLKAAEEAASRRRNGDHVIEGEVVG